MDHWYVFLISFTNNQIFYPKYNLYITWLSAIESSLQKKVITISDDKFVYHIEIYISHSIKHIALPTNSCLNMLFSIFIDDMVAASLQTVFSLNLACCHLNCFSILQRRVYLMEVDYFRRWGLYQIWIIKEHQFF